MSAVSDELESLKLPLPMEAGAHDSHLFLLHLPQTGTGYEHCTIVALPEPDRPQV